MLKEIIKKFIPSFLISWYHFFLAFLGAVFYRFPSRLRPAFAKASAGKQGFGRRLDKVGLWPDEVGGQARSIKVIGVTGTKGKTTVVYLAGRILEEAGFKVGWISSATLKIGDKEWLNPYHITMPGRFFIQRFLRQMINTGCHYALIEVTSEGILQYRHRFIDFNTAVFTNLAPEHIEAHGGFEKYKAAKGKLFQTTRNIHIINLDDGNVEYFLQFPAKEKYGYTMNSEQKTANNKKLFIVHYSLLTCDQSGISFEVQNTKFNLKLLGNFNIYNVLAAICVGLSQGVSLEVCQKALEKVTSIPGRVEIINEGQDFTVIVDLAHTPDSFEKVFQLVKGLPHNKIISVFGAAGGGRDKWKRPELGKIAAKYSDYIILTNEDPYDENPMEIIDQVAKGAENISVNQRLDQRKSAVFKILDRKEAIKKSLSLAKSGDIVLVLGKGTEQTMVIGSKKIPWDDREVVREEIKKIRE